MNFPDELKYVSTHEWVRVENGEATIGISDHAQSELGDIVFVELPEAGRFLQQGESFGTVESVKTVSDVYAPVSGEVIEVNDKLVSQSELVNTDPYQAGWFIKIRMDKPQEVDQLMDAASYESQLEVH